MGLPQNVLSTVAIPDEFLAPRDRRRERLVDYELGGVGIQDPSEGLRVKTWRCRYVEPAVILDAPGVSATTIVQIDGINEIAFTFDQNMAPFLAYQRGTRAFFRWFDATVPGFVTTELPAGTRSPRCSLDDKRRLQTNASDIILAYIRGTSLYYREQRDRFETEYELTSLADMEFYQLGQIGMNAAALPRFQFSLVGRVFPDFPDPPNPAPVLSAIDPTFAARGASGFTLTLTGSGFIDEGDNVSVVRVNGEDRATTVVSGEELEASILSTDLEDAGTLEVRVFNPEPGGGLSAAQSFEVRNPVPAISSLSPESVVAGSDDTLVTIAGSGFVPESVARVDGAGRATTYISASELRVTLLEADLAEEGSIAISVASPLPGGGTSGSAMLSVTTPSPSSYPELVIAAAPLRYYRLEETSGSVAADAMEQEALTIQGDVSLGEDGAVGRAFGFGGAGRVHGSSAPQTAGSKSYEFGIMLRGSESGINSYIIGRSNTFDVVFNYGGTDMVGVFRNASPSISVTALRLPIDRDDEWHHVVIAYDHAEGEVAGYVDGVLVDSFSASADFVPSNLISLAASAANSDRFVGSLDEVAIYDYALSAADVAAHYAAFVGDEGS